MGSAMLIKTVVKGLATGGAATIVWNVVKATTPKDMCIVNKICVILGGVVLGSIASDAAATKVDEMIEEAAAGVKTAKTEFENCKNE